MRVSDVMPALAARVLAEPRMPCLGGERAEVDDASPALARHDRPDGAHRPPGALHAGAPRQVELLVGDLLERRAAPKPCALFTSTSTVP